MGIETKFTDLGLINYQDAYNYQEKVHSEIMYAKFNRTAPRPEEIIFCEHNHVYTLGKSGNQNNLLIDYIHLQTKNAEFYHTNRGGDITYHGPGQIVGYPIIDLDKRKIGVKKYVWLLEEAVIQTLKDYQIEAGRLEGATGVWLDVDQVGKTRKINAIGVRISRGITMHGFAFNINTDLSYFQLINPCGFVDKGVTSMQNELGKTIDMQKVKNILLKKLINLLDIQLI